MMRTRTTIPRSVIADVEQRVRRLCEDLAAKLQFHGWHHVSFVRDKSVHFAGRNGAAADIVEASPIDVGLTRTRCVATMLKGGHADNALPQSAQATVNCRIMPGVQPKDVQAELQNLVGPKVQVTPDPAYIGEPTPASPLRPDVRQAVTNAIHSILGAQVDVYAVMAAGASDGSFFRAKGMPVYDVDGSWGISPLDDRAHGLDERIPVRAMYDDVVYWQMIIRALAGG